MLLWSRTAQQCRCRGCIQAASSIGRPTVPRPRKITAGDVFTACYSAIFATATIADTVVKKKRRDNWDQAIQEVKEQIQVSEPSNSHQHDLDQPSADSVRSTVPHGSKVQLQRSEESSERQQMLSEWPAWKWKTFLKESMWNTDHRHCRYGKLQYFSRQAEGGSDSEHSQERAFGRQAELSSSTRQPRAPQRTERSDHESDIGPKRLNRNRLAKVEIAVRELVDRLLETLGRQRETYGLSPETEHLLYEIQLLRAGTKQYPQFIASRNLISVHSEGQANATASALDDALTTIRNSARSSKQASDTMLAKICYNLLISSVPCTNQTMNILLEIFFAKEMVAATNVICSVLLDTKGFFKPSMKTITLLLAHHVTTNNVSGYESILKLMRGVGGSLVSCRQNVSTNAASLSSGKFNYARSDNCYHQKMPRNSAVFDALVITSVHFGKIRHAARQYVAALREGYSISIEALKQLIQGCVDSMDDIAAFQVLRATVLQTDDMSTFLDPKYNFVESFNLLLSLSNLQYSMSKMHPEFYEGLAKFQDALVAAPDASRSTVVLLRSRQTGQTPPIASQMLSERRKRNQMVCHSIRLTLLEHRIRKAAAFGDDLYSKFFACMDAKSRQHFKGVSHQGSLLHGLANDRVHDPGMLEKTNGLQAVGTVNEITKHRSTQDRSSAAGGKLQAPPDPSRDTSNLPSHVAMTTAIVTVQGCAVLTPRNDQPGGYSARDQHNDSGSPTEIGKYNIFPVQVLISRSSHGTELPNMAPAGRVP